jgi:hypothetical protein
MTPEDRAEEIAHWFCVEGTAFWSELRKHVLEAVEAAVRAERERCAKIAENPYGDEVRALGLDEPSMVGRKIAAALRAAAGRPREEQKSV